MALTGRVYVFGEAKELGGNSIASGNFWLIFWAFFALFFML